MKERKLFQKQDILLVSALVVLALIFFGVYIILNRNTGKTFCQITYDGSLTKTLDLSKDFTFALEQNQNVRFKISNHAVGFIESDCPDKICIHSGFLSIPGQTAACLPNRVSIRIVAAEADIDMIAY